MPCNNQFEGRSGSRDTDNEIICCNTLYEYQLVPEENGRKELVCTPCDQPTAVFDVATITEKSNACTGLTYYQAAINTDPVQIIQDCNLKCIICRCIEAYMSNNSCGCGCNSSNNNGFSLF